MTRFPCLWTILAAGLLAGPGAVRGEIVSASYHPAETIDLTATGTVDWCVYRVADAAKGLLVAADWKKGGLGVAREIAVSGRLKKVEETQWTGVGWGWSDGTKTLAHTHRQGDRDGSGIRASIASAGALVFAFPPAPSGRVYQAHLIVRSDGKVRILAEQGEASKKIQSFAGGKHLGVAVVRYNGPLGVTIRLHNPGPGDQVVRGFAAAVGKVGDYTGDVPRLPTRQEQAAARADAAGAIDYLQVARDFADCMIAHGRDRYGTVHSPLFAVLLLRTDPPAIGPEPYFARPSPYNTSNMNTPFRKYDFNRCLNYPPGLGSEGPHKVTLTGCDVYEDQDLYTMLIDLTRITGEGKYKAEATKALTWWFTRTMGPAGLYPWGEHLGWDFEHECPTYFAGPSKHLYAACYHEIKDRVPFLDVLAALPAREPGKATYLQRYALGVWKAHYWDPDHAVYCRHGDYTGADDRKGSLAGFPAHQGAHLRLWAAALLHARNADDKAAMRQILHKVLDVQIARAKKYGFVPFTFDPDVKGKDPGKKPPAQSIRLATHAAEVSVALARAEPALAGKLRELARLHLGEGPVQRLVRAERARRAAPDRHPLDAPAGPGPRPAARVADLSGAETPAPHARQIVRLLGLHRTSGQAAYLRAAERQARLAYVRFCDRTCPLPKAHDGPARKTLAGKPFGSFSFRGASLMHAFALLGEALRK